MAGFARFNGTAVAVVGHQKGNNFGEMAARNFGMANPEGYRKSMRIMELAERWQKPLLTFIDTPGAFPGVGAEERGQAETIASSIEFMFSLSVPVISVVTGEGGSGGALAIGVGNRILMMENAIYAVISPEGCAAILWRDGSKGPLAADVLKPTAQDLFSLGVIDEIIPEPFGGAHRDWEATFQTAAVVIERHLRECSQSPAKSSGNSATPNSGTWGYSKKGNGNYWGSRRPLMKRKRHFCIIGARVARRRRPLQADAQVSPFRPSPRLS